MEEGGDIGDPDLLDILAVAPKLRDHDARRRVEPQDTRLPRRDETVLKRHRYRSDGAVPAHRQAAGGFDEQERDIAIGARRRIENGARHDVVAARLEHQSGADPVEFGHEMRALFDHRGAVQLRAAAGHQPHRISAGMAVDAEEAMPRHGYLRVRNYDLTALVPQCQICPPGAVALASPQMADAAVAPRVTAIKPARPSAVIRRLLRLQ